jgi:hypothetical protein
MIQSLSSFVPRLAVNWPSRLSTTVEGRLQTFQNFLPACHMCAPLTDMSKDFGEKPIAHHALLLILPVNRFALLVGKTRPTRNSWREVVG